MTTITEAALERLEKLQEWMWDGRLLAATLEPKDREQHATDLAALISLVRGVMPRPIEEAPIPFNGYAIIFEHPLGGGGAHITDKQDNEGGWWVGDWEHQLMTQYFIPLSSLPLPQEESNG